MINSSADSTTRPNNAIHSKIGDHQAAARPHQATGFVANGARSNQYQHWPGADDGETVRWEKRGFGFRSRVVDYEIRVQVELSLLADQEIGDMDRRQRAAI